MPITLTLNGLKSHVYTWGQSHRPPLLLLHDGMYGADALTAWDQVAPILADEYFVIAPDLLGFGQSDKVVFLDRSPYLPRLDQIEALIEAFSLTQPCHIVGTSFGASLTLRTLERNRVSMASVVAISGTGGPWRVPAGIVALNDYPEPDLNKMRALLEQVTGHYAGFEQLVQRRYENTLIPGHFEAIAAMGLRNPAIARTSPPADSYPATLTERTTPVLLIAGAKDPLLEPNWAQRLADHLPTAEVSIETLATGHSPNLDHAELTASTLLSFLRRHR
jgi:pimeloyl-ACP methyl ester carboxylesterase